MASLKETKGRIGSVRTTLKTTSAMKLVASAKLRKAQAAISGALPYRDALEHILSTVVSAAGASALPSSGGTASGKAAVVAVASNSSLCGAFNANVARLALSTVSELKESGSEVTVFSVGRKISEAMKKAGYLSPEDYTKLAEKPSYEAASAFCRRLRDLFEAGEFSRIELVYNHFVSTAKQVAVRSSLLPFSLPEVPPDDRGIILEPSGEELLKSLVPKVLELKFYSVLLDSAAAEHAARTVAMQTATDNGEQLLDELTLEYNKARQQKITSEILDLAGGAVDR